MIGCGFNFIVLTGEVVEDLGKVNTPYYTAPVRAFRILNNFTPLRKSEIVIMINKRVWDREGYGVLVGDTILLQGMLVAATDNDDLLHANVPYSRARVLVNNVAVLNRTVLPKPERSIEV